MAGGVSVELLLKSGSFIIPDLEKEAGGICWLVCLFLFVFHELELSGKKSLNEKKNPLGGPQVNQ